MLTNCMGKVGKYSLSQTMYCRQKFACHITTYMSYVRGRKEMQLPHRIENDLGIVACAELI